MQDSAHAAVTHGRGRRKGTHAAFALQVTLMSPEPLQGIGDLLRESLSGQLFLPHS